MSNAKTRSRTVKRKSNKTLWVAAALLGFANVCFVVSYAYITSRATRTPADLAARMPAGDAMILKEVADEYHLRGNARRLLYVIRLIENGPPGVEMGVLTVDAMRFKGHHDASLRLQAQWAAGTIAKRYHNDLLAFSKRWCPPSAHPKNKYWLPNARKLMWEGV